MAGSLDLKDSELSDLFDRYPDINFDPAEDNSLACGISEQFSSPCSNTTDHHTPKSKNATSTAHTSPIWPRTRSPDDHLLPSLDLFFGKVDSADLPLLSKEGFRSLAREMSAMGQLLVPQSGDYYDGYVDANKPKLRHHASALFLQLRHSNDRVGDEIDNIDFVESRAPFIVEPALEDLWCIYRQRAKLIAQYISLPSRSEQDILEDLSHVFDAFVYNPFLELLSLDEVDVELEGAIHEVYDILMTLLHKYTLWMRGMKNLKEYYMQPLLKRIKNSPEIRRDLAEDEFVKAMAKASIGSLEGPGMQPADERTIQELNLSTSRRHAPVPLRVRSRYRREHTV